MVFGFTDEEIKIIESYKSIRDENDLIEAGIDEAVFQD